MFIEAVSKQESQWVRMVATCIGIGRNDTQFSPLVQYNLRSHTSCYASWGLFTQGWQIFIDFLLKKKCIVELLWNNVLLLALQTEPTNFCIL